MTQTCSPFVQKQFVPSAAALRGKKNSLKLHISRTLTIHTFPFSFAGISLSVFLDVSCFCDSNLRQWIGNCSEWANKYSVCVGNTGSCNYPKWNSVCESVCCIAAEQTDIKSVFVCRNNLFYWRRNFSADDSDCNHGDWTHKKMQTAAKSLKDQIKEKQTSLTITRLKLEDDNKEIIYTFCQSSWTKIN